MDSLAGIMGTFAESAPFFRYNSCRRGFGGGRKKPSGSLQIPSLVPKTPISLSTLS